ncbi:hypothetical protein RQP46_010582 [Phenoliferia psychrophenolica]
MSTAKAALYSANVDLARRLDLLSAAHPVDLHGKVNRNGASVEGGGLDWKELQRKFAKHNPAREVTTLAVRAELTIHSLLTKASLAASFNPDTSHSSDSPSLNPSAPPSIAWPPLIQADDRNVVLAALAALDAALSHDSASPVEANSARVINALGQYAVGDFEGARAALDGVDLKLPNSKWEAYDLTLTVQANLLEGYTSERLEDFGAAQSAYARAGRVYDDVCDILAKSGGTKDDRALHKLGEDALYRSAFWSSSSPDSHVAFLPHRLYLKHALQWSTVVPTKTLLVHRSLRALLHEVGPSPAAPADWYTEVADNNRAEEAVLRRTTSLPPAGEINKPYLRFLDDVAEGWRIGGGGREGVTEVIDIMYNALSHTFQSQRLLRHLIYALTSKASYSEAGKALTLYLELFDKARETDAAQVARDVRKFRTRANSAAAGQPPQLEPHSSPLVDKKEGADGEEFDIDSDRLFVRTLTFGVRVVCKYLDDPVKGLKMARRARAIFDEGKDAKLKEDKVEESRIERALGVALGALTAKESDLETRPTMHAQALQHLERASSLDPTSWETLYHLSYQLFELRQIAPALDQARAAVRLHPSSRDCWHLLALLVGAQKDLAASLQVLETALDDERDKVDEQEESNGKVNGTTANGNGYANGYANGNGASYSNGNGNGNGVTPPVGNGNSSADALPRDETEVLASEVQIRMTKNVVIEAMEGPEAALLDQQVLLAYFSTAYADLRQQPETPGKIDPLVNGSLPVASTKRSVSILGRRKSMRLSSALHGDTLGVASQAGSRLSVASAMTTTAREQSLSPSVLSLDATGVQSTSSTGPAVETNARATKLLVDLWLMTAASFRRAGKLDDARGAIQEAEVLNADDPDVWVQFALVNVANGLPEEARTCLIKALAFDLSHISATVLLARLYLSTGPAKLPYAEGMLDTLTKRQAWDVPEAWFELSRCYKGTNRLARERECLVWALQLEETKSVRPLSCLPRLL